MKIETIYYLHRLNLGSYCHAEMSATAKVEDNEDASTAMVNLKTLVIAALEGKVAEVKAETVKPVEEVKEVVAEEVKEKPKKAAPKKKEAVAEAPKVEEVVAPVVEATKEVDLLEDPIAEVPPQLPKKFVAYDPTIAQHKSIFAGFLFNKYGEAWKTAYPKEEIQKFTSSLKGLEFIDETGTISPVFTETVLTFFGA